MLTSSSSPWRGRLRFLLWYVAFGAVHECAHLLCALLVAVVPGGCLRAEQIFSATGVLQILLGRRCVVPTTPTINGGCDVEFITAVIRHAGWVASVLLAAALHRLVHLRRSTKQSTDNKGGVSGDRSNVNTTDSLDDDPVGESDGGSMLLLAAYVTALEAVSTDLLRLPLHFGWTHPAATAAATAAAATTTFYCGNFGLILLNPAWTNSDAEGGTCRSALGVLRTMVRVTMMRGAQSGGVVTFAPTNEKGRRLRSIFGGDGRRARGELAGIRSRVVNRKRTDLSDLVISKLRRDAFSSLGGKIAGGRGGGCGGAPSSPLVRIFSGHTRFATSSVANLDGTHPHRWTPPATRRVYDFGTGRITPTRVENYICHNGDFDAYDFRPSSSDGRTQTHEVESAVRPWLERVLGCRAPSKVDSVAIAGFVDLLRTKGCFALSIRYAVSLGLPGGGVDGCHDDEAPPPTARQYERLAALFEDGLDELLRRGSDRRMSTEIGDYDMRERRELASAVMKKLKKAKDCEDVLRPFEAYLEDNDNDGAGEAADDDDGGEGGGIEGSGSSSGGGRSLSNLVRVTIDAFFDNDLLHVTKTFLSNAHGSFGLCVTSSLDAHRQLCLAARGQTMSVAFYPKKGVICYGSEQAAVKAALGVDVPGSETEKHGAEANDGEKDDDNDGGGEEAASRLDLDDLGGEICLLDWGYHRASKAAAATEEYPQAKHRNMKQYYMMREDAVQVTLVQQSKTIRQVDVLSHRMTTLEGNDLIQPLKKEAEDDIVLSDIRSIPRVCREIQKDWQNAGADISFNRLTAVNLARCVIRRVEAIAHGGTVARRGAIDIVLTGCEVSLWLAEQFASDLKKALPKLNVVAVSSNKILGLFGQEQSIPVIGYPMSQRTNDLTDAIVIICSHSGGTFGPLQCSNLLQSTTKNIFAVTSEWDTQVGRQLRSMYTEEDALMFNSRIFTTGVGLAPAEPCSVTVAAMHQLLTNIFEHVCVVVVSDPHFRHVTGATVTERDLQILERCNRDNIAAMEGIVGVDSSGMALKDGGSRITKELRSVGNLWSAHVLENARAYIMSFVYIVVTVTLGWPLISGIGHVAGAGSVGSSLEYILRFLDALVYFWLPQINIFILRLLQRRNLRHRMVGRTVVIGDCPWVAQAGEAFLSKLFACSYSIAGLNVLSGNPADHLVHRHTHRVVRGTLLVCGRPDGRLMALTSLESSVCLSVNQASSIQSWGGRCESVTIGHNPFEMPLCYKNIFLPRHRPLFLCERMLDMSRSVRARATTHRRPCTVQRIANYGNSEPRRPAPERSSMSSMALMSRYSNLKKESKNSQKLLARQRKSFRSARAISEEVDMLSLSRNGRRHTRNGSLDLSRNGRKVTSADILDLDLSRRERTPCSTDALDVSRRTNRSVATSLSVDDIIDEIATEQSGLLDLHRVFREHDTEGDGTLGLDQFMKAYGSIDPSLPQSDVIGIFEEADVEERGNLDFGQFFQVTAAPHMKLQAVRQNNVRDPIGLIRVRPSEEHYFDDDLCKKQGLGVSEITLAKSQMLSQELYEARIASLQRFVSMTVMFHQMGKRVQSFFSRISLGFWNYRIDRTQSIMRVATTASPVSGAYVREQMAALRLATKINRSVHSIATAWFRYRSRKVKYLLAKTATSTPIGEISVTQGSFHDYVTAIGSSSSRVSELDMRNDSFGSCDEFGSLELPD